LREIDFLSTVETKNATAAGKESTRPFESIWGRLLIPHRSTVNLSLLGRARKRCLAAVEARETRPSHQRSRAGHQRHAGFCNIHSAHLKHLFQTLELRRNGL
jgi:hypothetical protein